MGRSVEQVARVGHAAQAAQPGDGVVGPGDGRVGAAVFAAEWGGDRRRSAAAAISGAGRGGREVVERES